jgi:hypothetical protein
MVGVKGRSGGRRSGAGRPRKESATQTPKASFASGKKTTLGLGFEKLKQTPGVTVLSEYQSVPTRMIQRGGEWVREAGAKAKLIWRRTEPASEAYAGMNKWYCEYRRDTLVRSCINTLAFFATSKGFETVLEPPREMEEAEAQRYVEQYKGLKDYIDEVNRKVNLDKILYTAVVKAKIFGCAGFEIVSENNDVVQLLPLDSTSLEPEINEDWTLTGFKYEGKSGFYAPEEILYFANNCLEADLRGLSDIEPVLDALGTRRVILSEAFKEAATVLWAGIGLLQVDTSGLTDEEAAQVIDDVINAIKPGKWVAVNQKITSQVVDLKPDLTKLVEVCEYLDAEIIGNFKVPRFLIGREKQFNRATAYAELDAFVNGPIADIQRWLRREIEKQWYERLARKYLKLKEDEELPVLVKHKWKPVTHADYVELFNALTQAYAQGLGWLPREKAYELAGFDPKELQKPAI